MPTSEITLLYRATKYKSRRFDTSRCTPQCISRSPLILGLRGSAHNFLAHQRSRMGLHLRLRAVVFFNLRTCQSRSHFPGHTQNHPKTPQTHKNMLPLTRIASAYNGIAPFPALILVQHPEACVVRLREPKYPPSRHERLLSVDLIICTRSELCLCVRSA